ncbi:MAG: DUF1592 domain-containing protein [Planctomycetia bacterium]|nr:DUF1592 domain-containing protein [Planctomycetia bacterium]
MNVLVGFAKAETFDGDVQPFLKKYCFDCHEGDQAEGGVSMASFAEVTAKNTDRVHWQKILRQLQGKVMPPKDSPQPDESQRKNIMVWIESFALMPDCSKGERPGRVTLRRLNRAEYNNTIRDLFGIDIKPADIFPSDDVGYGFDNIGDVLTLPPVLLERYLEAAENVMRAVIVTADIDTAPIKTGKGGTLASRGEIGQEFDLSADGQYVVRARAFGDQAGDEPVQMEFRIDGKEKKKVDVSAKQSAPQDYEITLRLEKGKHQFAVAFLNDYYKPDAPDPKQRGDRNLHVEKLTVIGPVGVMPEELPEAHKRFFSKPIEAKIDRDTQRQQVRDLVRPLASRAFRRRATDAEMDGLVALFDFAREKGETVERSMQITTSAILVSPSFLFRIEKDAPSGKTRTLSDVEMASRLSYFLWSSLPDDELFRAGVKGELHTDKQLIEQALRMLKDPKSKALVENFAGQWLQLRNLDTFFPDKERFPDYDDALKSAMRRETEEFFSYLVREDRSVLEFLDADYTFVNERLAKHYGLQGISGEEFRRVSVDPAQRGGLLGQASILSVTSNPTRTSPVKRGKWILENLFASPPPPPPPNVPELAVENKEKPLTGTLRQQMEQHRSDPSCAACHQLMDPLGFGLENYNAVGAWRTDDGLHPVDPSGELPDGRSFKGPAELKTILKGREEEFRRCFAEKMLTYAIGRGLEHYDACAVQRISRECAENGNRFSVIVTEIVLSPAFRQRESP